jgi:hypothetical protein
MPDNQPTIEERARRIIDEGKEDEPMLVLAQDVLDEIVAARARREINATQVIPPEWMWLMIALGDAWNPELFNALKYAIEIAFKEVERKAKAEAKQELLVELANEAKALNER